MTHGAISPHAEHAFAVARHAISAAYYASADYTRPRALSEALAVAEAARDAAKRKRQTRALRAQLDAIAVLERELDDALARRDAAEAAYYRALEHLDAERLKCVVDVGLEEEGDDVLGWVSWEFDDED